MLYMRNKPNQARSGFEAGEHDFVKYDCDQSHEGNPQGVVVEYGNCEQSQAEKNEFDWNTENGGNLRRHATAPKLMPKV